MLSNKESIAKLIARYFKNIKSNTTFNKEEKYALEIGIKELGIEELGEREFYIYKIQYCNNYSLDDLKLDLEGSSLTPEENSYSLVYNFLYSTERLKPPKASEVIGALKAIKKKYLDKDKLLEPCNLDIISHFLTHNSTPESASEILQELQNNPQYFGILPENNKYLQDYCKVLTDKFSSCDEFLKALQEFKTIKSIPIIDKNALASKYLLINTNTSVDDFIKILVATDNKMDQIRSFIIHHPDQQNTLGMLEKILNDPASDALKFDPDKVSNLIQSAVSFNKRSLRQTIDFVNTIHSNSEYDQVEILIDLVKSKHLYPEHIDLNALKDFITKLRNDNNILGLVTALQKAQLLPDNQRSVLELVQGRIAERFKFIEELINESSTNSTDKEFLDLTKFLTEDGLETIGAIFSRDDIKGKEWLKTNKISILDLISYFEVAGKLENLSEILEPKFKTRLQNSLAPSKTILLTSPEEIRKLSQLSGISTPEIEAKFIKNEALCEYFIREIGDKILVLTEDERCSFKIGEGNLHSPLTDNQKTNLEKKFRLILLNDEPTQENVVDFVENMGVEVNAINENNRGKILEFFKRSKNDLAVLLQKENGMENFMSALQTLGDGCAHNIGTQFTTALYSSLLTQEKDQILYPILVNDIVTEILNSGGDVIGSESNPFKNRAVQNYFLSPEALFDMVANVFIGEQEIGATQKKQGQDSYGFIERFLESEFKYKSASAQAIKGIIADVTEYDNTKVRDVAAYLILANTIGRESALKAGERSVKAKNILYSSLQQEGEEFSDDIFKKEVANGRFGSKTTDDIPSATTKPITEATKRALTTDDLLKPSRN